jgi:hypothetical protein
MISHTMERGGEDLRRLNREGDGRATKGCYTHLDGAHSIEMRQSSKGMFKEMIGWETATKFKYFNADKVGIAHSTEHSDCFCRSCCA